MATAISISDRGPLSLQTAPHLDQPAACPARPQTRLDTNIGTSLRENGCFEFDRVIKSGYVQKRTQKTKAWKTIFLTLRPGTLSIYKNEKESKLRHQLHLSDLTAVALLKDPKHKRHNVFGLFSPSKNYHFEAPSAQDAQEWVDLLRRDARIEEEEEEMFLASPVIQQHSPGGMIPVSPGRLSGDVLGDQDRVLSSSPEPIGWPTGNTSTTGRRKSYNFESSGVSGNELASHSDFSDSEMQRAQGTSIESFAVPTPLEPGSWTSQGHPDMVGRSISQISVNNANPNTGASTGAAAAEQDMDRVIWQGWIWLLRSKGGVRQWKDMWGVLRPRNFILYKDEAEYTARWIVPLSSVVNVVDIDPLSRTKTNCLQIITEEKSYRFCTHDEESLVQFIGACKSLLARRRARASVIAAQPAS